MAVHRFTKSSAMLIRVIYSGVTLSMMILRKTDR